MSGSRSDPAPGTPAETPGPTPPQTPGEVAFQTPLPANADGISAAGAVAAAPASSEAPTTGSTTPRKGPLSFLSGALTSGVLAWVCFVFSRRVLAYYSLHPPHYEARVAQSIATALKTLIVGMTFLATFSFAFVGLGLTLVFVRSLLQPEPRSPA